MLGKRQCFRCHTGHILTLEMLKLGILFHNAHQHAPFCALPYPGSTASSHYTRSEVFPVPGEGRVPALISWQRDFRSARGK
jgi:hypothetical protein